MLYHDWEAQTYDGKWSISFDRRCIEYARDRFEAITGTPEPLPYGTALELGAGTGFFSLNLKQAGVLDEVHVTDLSPGMVEAAKANAETLGFSVEGRVADAERIPYDDNTFDVVVGHAVIHHIPDVEAAFAEMLRVLKPGGRFVIAGEPTRIGDWYARRLGRLTWRATTGRHPPAAAAGRVGQGAGGARRVVPGGRARGRRRPAHLRPRRARRAWRERAGAVDVRTQTEELTAAFLGWPVRTFEAAVKPGALGWSWAMFAYGSWKRLSAVDRVLVAGRPAAVLLQRRHHRREARLRTAGSEPAVTSAANADMSPHRPR